MLVHIFSSPLFKDDFFRFTTIRPNLLLMHLFWLYFWSFCIYFTLLTSISPLPFAFTLYTVHPWLNLCPPPWCQLIYPKGVDILYYRYMLEINSYFGASVLDFCDISSWYICTHISENFAYPHVSLNHLAQDCLCFLFVSTVVSYASLFII
jgi:hypothetical protein